MISWASAVCISVLAINIVDKVLTTIIQATIISVIDVALSGTPKVPVLMQHG